MNNNNQLNNQNFGQNYPPNMDNMQPLNSSHKSNNPQDPNTPSKKGFFSPFRFWTYMKDGFSRIRKYGSIGILVIATIVVFSWSVLTLVRDNVLDASNTASRTVKYYTDEEYKKEVDSTYQFNWAERIAVKKTEKASEDKDPITLLSNEDELEEVKKINSDLTIAYFFISVATFLVYVYFNMIVHYTSYHSRYRKVSIAEGALKPLKHFPSYFILQLNIVILTFLWSLLFIIPGIYKSAKYSLAGLYFFENPKGNGILGSIRKSHEIMKKEYAPMILFQILLVPTIYGFGTGAAATISLLAGTFSKLNGDPETSENNKGQTPTQQNVNNLNQNAAYSSAQPTNPTTHFQGSTPLTGEQTTQSNLQPQNSSMQNNQTQTQHNQNYSQNTSNQAPQPSVNQMPQSINSSTVQFKQNQPTQPTQSPYYSANLNTVAQENTQPSDQIQTTQAYGQQTDAQTHNQQPNQSYAQNISTSQPKMAQQQMQGQQVQNQQPQTMQQPQTNQNNYGSQNTPQN